MTNTFDNENGTFYLLIYDEDWYRFWPRPLLLYQRDGNSIYEPASH
jgi:uncharacterized protein YbdZ (MbtH family)